MSIIVIAKSIPHHEEYEDVLDESGNPIPRGPSLYPEIDAQLRRLPVIRKAGTEAEDNEGDPARRFHYKITGEPTEDQMGELRDRSTDAEDAGGEFSYDYHHPAIGKTRSGTGWDSFLRDHAEMARDVLAQSEKSPAILPE